MFHMLIIVPIVFLVISAHCMTRMELPSAFKMILRMLDTNNSERPKEQTCAGNYSIGEPVQNTSGLVVGEAKYTG